MVKFDIGVLGGGFLGMSAAYHLKKNAPRLKVALFDEDKKICNHSSGHNAGMIRQSLEDPKLAQMAVWGRRQFEQYQKNLKFNYLRNGSLLLSKETHTKNLTVIQSNLRKYRVDSISLSSQEVKKRYPILRESQFSKALFTPSDALVDIYQLAQSFVKALRKVKVDLVVGKSISKIDRLPFGGYCVQSGQQTVYADKLVNAAGAWAHSVANLCGAQDVSLSAYKRHLFVLNSHSLVSSSAPFTWHLSDDWYFRPNSEGVLFSPCDKKLYPLKQFSLSKKVDVKVRKLAKSKLVDYLPDISKQKIIYETASLRTSAADGRFLIGQDANLNDFYWLAGFGGHGVTVCLSAGQMLSELMSGKPSNPELASNFSPKRFTTKAI